MPWIRMPGLPGKVYVPADDGRTPKKYPCHSCHACQWCEDNRCRVCRGGDEAGDIDNCCCCGHKQSPLATATHKTQTPNLK